MEILKRVRKLELKTKKLVDGLISGNYRSVFKGRGIEFSEVREYVPGDDIRSIDWNVTARMGSPYVKEFTEERDLNVFIVFDSSASGNFGTEKSKKEVGMEIAASIMFSALRNNDNIGLALFTEKVERFFRPRKGRKHFLRMIRELMLYQPKKKGTDINASVIYLSRVIKKRSIIFIISDFISGDFEKALKFLRNKNDIILVRLSDKREEEVPDIGYVLVEDEETGEQILVNTSDPEFRKAYHEKSKKIGSHLMKRMRRLNIDVINIPTEQPFYLPIVKFFKMREKRMR